jgi:hypothetical protein
MKLRVWWLLILWSVATTALAWIPTPISVALSVGQWLQDEASKERIFEIRVEAQADTEDRARNEGFRRAVEQAVGTMVLSETEVQNGKVSLRELVNYSSGFVYRYNIVSKEPLTQGGVKLVMDVTVRRSAIADRLLNGNVGSAPIPAQDMAARIDTILDERQRGDQLVAQVLRDFPRKAFDIQPGQPRYEITADRQVKLTVPWVLQWNYNYVRALYEAMQTTGQERISCWTYPHCPQQQYEFAVTVLHPNAWFQKDVYQTNFSDPRKIQMVIQAMLGSQPVMQLIIRDNANQVAHTSCHRYQELDHQHGYHITNVRLLHVGPMGAGIDQTRKLPGHMTVNIRQHTAAIANLERVEIRVVPGSQCFG